MTNGTGRNASGKTFLLRRPESSRNRQVSSLQEGIFMNQSVCRLLLASLSTLGNRALNISPLKAFNMMSCVILYTQSIADIVVYLLIRVSLDMPERILLTALRNRHKIVIQLLDDFWRFIFATLTPKTFEGARKAKVRFPFSWASREVKL